MLGKLRILSLFLNSFNKFNKTSTHVRSCMYMHVFVFVLLSLGTICQDCVLIMVFPGHIHCVYVVAIVSVVAISLILLQFMLSSGFVNWCFMSILLWQSSHQVSC